jgi:hypothetical protein
MIFLISAEKRRFPDGLVRCLILAVGVLVVVVVALLLLVGIHLEQVHTGLFKQWIFD